MEKATFALRVLHVVRCIPPGRAATYGDVAALAGSPGAARAAGSVMKNCRAPGIPCHRVVAAGGRLGGFGGNPALKRALLAAEGVAVRGSRLVNWRAVRWPRGLDGTRPITPKEPGRTPLRL